jgi:hypothetical protein
LSTPSKSNGVYFLCLKIAARDAKAHVPVAPMRHVSKTFLHAKQKKILVRARNIDINIIRGAIDAVPTVEARCCARIGPKSIKRSGL